MVAGGATVPVAAAEVGVDQTSAYRYPKPRANGPDPGSDRAAPASGDDVGSGGGPVRMG